MKVMCVTFAIPFRIFTTGFRKFIEIDLHRSVSNVNGIYSSYYTLYSDAIATCASSFDICVVVTHSASLIHATCVRSSIATFFLIIIFFICCLRISIVSAFMANRYHFGFTWMGGSIWKTECMCALNRDFDTHLLIWKETTNFRTLWMGSVSGKRLNLSDAQFESTLQ